jgi:hexulose-6-phosphate isomerase
MKRGLNAWSVPAETPLVEFFKLCKQHRYHGIELNMTELEAPVANVGNTAATALTHTMGEKEWARVGILAEKAGVEISSIASGLFWKYPLTSTETCQQGKAVIKMMIDCAAYLRCATILVVPGIVTATVSYQQAYDRALDALVEVSEYAESKNVIIGIENVWNKFLLSPLEMARFLDEIDSTHVKAYFDVGNILQFGFPQHWIEVLGDRIASVHVKDFDPSIGNISGFKPLLQGRVPWAEVMQALRNIGYDGFVSAELTPYPTNPLQLVADTAAAFDYIFSL